jgi:hypothetical protein
MAWLFPWLLFFHVMGAILTFGPTYAFGTYAGLAANERGPALAFNNRARSAVVRRFVTPGTFVVLVTGALMIWAREIPWLDPAFRWLQLAIVIYLGMIAWNLAVSVPQQKRIAALGAQAAAQAAERAAAVSPPGGVGGLPGGAGGPPPEMAALIGKVRRDGKIMGVLIVLIVFLMVVKPQLGP